MPMIVMLLLYASPETPPPQLTLEAALAYANSHNPDLATAQAQVEQGVLEERVPKSRWLPQVGATGQFFGATDNNSTAVSMGSPVTPLPRVGDSAFSQTSSWKPYASSILGIGIAQQVFDFGFTAAQIAAANAALAADRADLTTRALDVRLAVTVAYRSVQAAHAVLSAAHAAALRAGVHRDQAAALVAGELRSRIFLERAEAEVAQLHIGELHAEAGVEVARTGLATVIGFEGPEADTTADEGTVSIAVPELATAIDRAIADAPEIKSLHSQIESQRDTADAIDDRTHPVIFATAALSGRAGGTPASGGGVPFGDGALPDVPNWDVGLVANWDIIDPTTSAAARAAHGKEQVLARQLEAAVQHIRAAASDAWVRSREAVRTLPELQKAFDAAKANYEQADVRFRQGLGTSVEIADAETLLTDAEIGMAQGRFELGQAKAFLDRAMAGGL